MFRTYFVILAALATLVTVSACSTPTKLDRHWGESFEAARQGQIMNPEAGKETGQAAGLDGSAALNGYESYHKGFKAKSTSKTVNVIKLR